MTYRRKPLAASQQTNGIAGSASALLAIAATYALKTAKRQSAAIHTVIGSPALLSPVFGKADAEIADIGFIDRAVGAGHVALGRSPLPGQE